MISVSTTAPIWGEIAKDRKGWVFNSDESVPGLVEAVDSVNNCKSIYDVYKISAPEYNDKMTVPVLWDKKTSKVVNNESIEILRMLNDEF